MNDEIFIKKAIELSKSAVKNGNEPFGAVLVKDNEIVFTNENQIYTKNDPTFHAEFGLIRRFIEETGICDLSSYALYSSCEPCAMCSGAMIWTKLGKLVYSSSNMDLEGILGGVPCDTAKPTFDNSFHHPIIVSGILREESLKVLKDYFLNHKKG